MFTMFAGPAQDSAPWSDSGVEGSHRYLKRLWNFAGRHADAVRAARPAAAPSAAAKALRREVHLLLRQISFDYDRLQYNTVVSGAMKLLNALEEAAADDSAAGIAARREGLSVLLRVLYPACPHVTWTLWRDLGYADEFGDLLDAPWPTVDEAALQREAIELVLQVNGKLRGAIVVPADADRHAIEVAARAAPEVARFSAGRTPKKVIVVPGKLVNVVV
jgi:leucyl-tRNA synthetase